MRSLSLITFLILCSQAYAQKVDRAYVEQQITKGAAYTVLMYKPGTEAPPKDSASAWQMGHLVNLFQLHVDKKIALFGPMGENKDNLIGMGIFNTTDTAQIRKWMDADPYVRHKVLKVELYPWMAVPDLKK